MILETERLIVRKFRADDAPLLFKYSQEEITKKELPDEVFDTLDIAREKIEFFNSQYDNGNIKVYAVELKSAKLLIGHISLSPVKEGIEIGYAIATDYQNNGYASEIVRPFTDWAKKNFGYDVIYAMVKAGNAYSVKTLENAGYRFSLEGERPFLGVNCIMRVYLG